MLPSIVGAYPIARAALCAAALIGSAVPAWANGVDDEAFIDPAARIGKWVESRAASYRTWRGDAELGYLETRGNVNARSLQTRGRVQHEREKWRHTARLDIVIREDEGTTAEQYQATQKSAFKLSAVDYLFELVRYTRNPSQNIGYQFAEVAGYGRRLAKTEAVVLDLEGGSGARQTRAVGDEPRSEGILVLAGELEWQVNARAGFSQTVYAESGRLNTLVTSASNFTLLIEKDFSMKVSYQVTHNTEVDPGIEHTDTVSTVTLVYSF